MAGIVIDVDDFKGVNDTHGHAFGDRVLVAIACAVSNAVRPDDICGRVGGDEFMVLLPDCPVNKAAEIAERVRVAVTGLNVEADSIAIKPTISLGVFEVPHDLVSVTAALEASVAPLRKAKNGGKNKVGSLVFQ